MDFRGLRAAAVQRFVAELGLPLAGEIAELDPYNALAGEVRDDALAFWRDQLRDDDTDITVTEDAEEG